jgi:fatty acid desaturase
MSQERSFDQVDYEAFARDVKALRDELDAGLGEADLKHLRKIEMWGRLCSLLGYATAWVFPNPFSAFLMSQGTLVRWTMMMHHVGHKGYDRVPGVSPRHTSTHFAKGWRRLVDFMDWLLPEAWNHEHNTLHHYHTGEVLDPDLLELNMEWLRTSRVPRALKYLVIAVAAMTWKWSYYLPRTLRAWHFARQRRAGVSPKAQDVRGLAPVDDMRNPLTPMGRDMWLRCVLPFVLVRFVLVPALFLPLGPWAALSVLVTSLMAEVFTNVHTFIVILPNHSGDDLYRFNTPISDRAELYVRSVIGSVNYRTGGDLNDFLHGWLNYQIEHHVWPDLTMLKYQQAQPRLKAICAQYGIPYVQEGVFKRFGHMVRIMSGERSMRWAATLPREKRLAARPHAVRAEQLSPAQLAEQPAPI